jgi:hypothetical protein
MTVFIKSKQIVKTFLIFVIPPCDIKYSWYCPFWIVWLKISEVTYTDSGNEIGGGQDSDHRSECETMGLLKMKTVCTSKTTVTT